MMGPRNPGVFWRNNTEDPSSGDRMIMDLIDFKPESVWTDVPVYPKDFPRNIRWPVTYLFSPVAFIYLTNQLLVIRSEFLLSLY